MTDAGHDSARGPSPGLGALLTGLVILVLPEQVAAVMGLALLYGSGALAVVCGVMWSCSAPRGTRHPQRWPPRPRGERPDAAERSYPVPGLSRLSGGVAAP